MCASSNTVTEEVLAFHPTVLPLVAIMPSCLHSWTGSLICEPQTEPLTCRNVESGSRSF